MAGWVDLRYRCSGRAHAEKLCRSWGRVCAFSWSRIEGQAVGALVTVGQCVSSNAGRALRLVERSFMNVHDYFCQGHGTRGWVEHGGGETDGDAILHMYRAHASALRTGKG
jgi:hypothetical protein